MKRVVTLRGGGPWGFRLQGGFDFHASLTVSRTTPGGKADAAGLKPTDVIISINNADASTMTHLQAQNHVKTAGQLLTLEVESAGEHQGYKMPTAPAVAATAKTPSPTPAQTPRQVYSASAAAAAAAAKQKPNLVAASSAPATKTWNPAPSKPASRPKEEIDLPPPPPNFMLQQQSKQIQPSKPAPVKDDLPPPPPNLTVPVSSNTSTGSNSQYLTCEGCKQEIRGPYLTAQGKNWHPEEFVCSSSNCRKLLQNCGFIEENGQRYCSTCYEKYFANACGLCHKKIVGEVMHALNQTWHVTCFVCTACRLPFRDGVFHLEAEKPYCVEDYNRLFSTLCKACGFRIEAGDHYVEAIKAQWHETCFTCTVCQSDLKNVGFFAVNDKPVCSNHKNARIPV